MAYDEALAERIRKALKGKRGVIEKKMFGCVAFMVRGNMCCGVIDKDLMMRVGPDAHDDTLKKAHARPMDFTGRPMKGMVYVAAKGIKTDKALKDWIDCGLDFVKTLPAK